MNIDTWLKQSIDTLKLAGISTARLDALVLLADEMGHDKAWVLAHPDYILQIEKLKKLSTKITHRAHHTPLAYIRGHAEFYGRDFAVDERVLVPRPESEDIIDELKKNVGDILHPLIVDVGTGSGCLAVTASLEIAPSTVVATEIDSSALIVAKANAKNLNSQAAFLRGDLLAPLEQYPVEGPVIILANLPYVPYDYPVNDAAKHEPKLALFSNDNGLEHYKRLFDQLQAMNLEVNAVITESLVTQHQALEKLAQSHGYVVSSVKGLVQTFVRNV